MLESLFNKEIWTQVFSFKICEIFKNNSLEERLRTTASDLKQGLRPECLPESSEKFFRMLLLRIPLLDCFRSFLNKEKMQSCSARVELVC